MGAGAALNGALQGIKTSGSIPLHNPEGSGAWILRMGDAGRVAVGEGGHPRKPGGWSCWEWVKTPPVGRGESARATG